MTKYVDLHMHSVISDGEKTPSELVVMAKDKNIEVISITDHDSVEGIYEGKRKGEELGVSVIPGVELSCFDRKDTHVLGYNVDCENGILIQKLDQLRKSRVERMEKMVDAMQRGGIDITYNEVQSYCKGQVMGRPHIAACLVAKGYARDVSEVFKKYIGSKCRYYVTYNKLAVKDGIDLIHKAGGAAILAHPKLLRYNSLDFTRLLKEYKQLGLDGIEVYYPCHYHEHVTLFYDLAKEHNMLITCGGDYHNDVDPKKSNMGYSMSLPGIEETVSTLLKAVKE